MVLMPASTLVAQNTPAASTHQKLTFDGDTALWTVAIKPDKTADFERIMKKVHEALYELYRGAFAQNLSLATGSIAVEPSSGQP